MSTVRLARTLTVGSVFAVAVATAPAVATAQPARTPVPALAVIRTLTCTGTVSRYYTKQTVAVSITGDHGVGRGFFYNDMALRDLDPVGIEKRWPQDAHPHESPRMMTVVLGPTSRP